jgi:hypothetical protein
MMRAVRWIVPALLALVVAVVAHIVIGATAGGSKHSSTSPTRSPAAVAPETTTAARPHPKRRRAATSVVRKSGRCGEITVNQYTSCAFARVVVKDYDAHPASSFLARSPVTGLTYTMRCEQAQGVVTCDDNSTSRLAFNGPPPSR